VVCVPVKNENEKLKADLTKQHHAKTGKLVANLQV
jgi:hypothetical protein